MKLKNRQTGQIVELELVVRNNDYLKDVIVETFYNEEPTIKKLYEDWEDYEEKRIRRRQMQQTNRAND